MADTVGPQPSEATEYRLACRILFHAYLYNTPSYDATSNSVRSVWRGYANTFLTACRMPNPRIITLKTLNRTVAELRCEWKGPESHAEALQRSVDIFESSSWVSGIRTAYHVPFVQFEPMQLAPVVVPPLPPTESAVTLKPSSRLVLDEQVQLERRHSGSPTAKREPAVQEASVVLAARKLHASSEHSDDEDTKPLFGSSAVCDPKATDLDPDSRSAAALAPKRSCSSALRGSPPKRRRSNTFCGSPIRHKEEVRYIDFRKEDLCRIKQQRKGKENRFPDGHSRQRASTSTGACRATRSVKFAGVPQEGPLVNAGISVWPTLAAVRQTTTEPVEDTDALLGNLCGSTLYDESAALLLEAQESLAGTVPARSGNVEVCSSVTSDAGPSRTGMQAGLDPTGRPANERGTRHVSFCATGRMLVLSRHVVELVQAEATIRHMEEARKQQEAADLAQRVRHLKLAKEIDSLHAEEKFYIDREAALEKELAELVPKGYVRRAL
ncbi:uncharacterized protein B0H18DRAFT_665355 [Fomitopsis serialis]|uniref:uncharacterized protein n=1 Tax=Fomitopsis serialis TaxID=139415 RepID=UPI002007C1A3|nr:uncharacterized protein B0H18DRAFT_665355 [Neoantrodia serialis]KAH9918606.1 hypothetical protein B0H18DRAFT_665355 [Neoantrodia serialis]